MSDTTEQVPRPRPPIWTPERKAKAAATRAANRERAAARLARRAEESKHAVAPTTAAPKTAQAEFAGLTAADCAAGCSEKGCVISGKPYCAHPRKGGLHPADLGNRTLVERIERAKKQIELQQLEK